jgi:hypothetical protein
MRQVWLQFLWFCLPLAIGWPALEMGLARVPNSFSAKRDGLRALSGQVDTVVLGSSEAFFGISPHALSGTAYNLANSAQPLRYSYEVMKRVVDELPALRRAVIQIDYVSLYAELYDHAENWRQYGYYQEWHIPLTRAIDYWDVRVVSRASLYKTASALIELGKGRPMTFATCIDDRGWCQAEADWGTPGLGAKDARSMLDGQQFNMHESHVPTNTAILEDLISMLRARGVEVDVVVMPVCPSYLAILPHDRWERTQEIVEGLARKHQARYITFEHESGMTDADFNDVNHLNAQGALRFTKMLDAALGPPPVKGRSGEALGASNGR